MRTSKLPHGAHFDGRIRGQGDLMIAGAVDGPIEIDGQLTIEATGVVRGDIRARSIAIAGHVEGNAHAVELIRLETGAKMIGDARAERVSAGTGALLRGRIRTSTERAQNERMRRTSGGTLLAPFSSSGGIAAPVFNDAPLRTTTLPGYFAPVEAETAQPVARVIEQPVEAKPLPPKAEVNAIEKPTEQKLTEQKPLERKPEMAKPVVQAEAREAQAPATPPRPVMPVIGRQKAVRRPEGPA